MSINKVMIGVGEIKLGMFVCELDRPWLETPFAFQGFRVLRVEDVQKLRELCEYVYVDVEKSLVLAPGAAGSAPPSPSSDRPKGGMIYRVTSALEEEIRTASEIRSASRIRIDEVFDDIVHGRTIDMQGVKQTVNTVVDGIIRNPDAHLCLTHLKKRDEYTAQHSINVCVLALALGRHLGLSRDELTVLGVGALLHDIGKLKTPLEVLNKPGRLTDEEFTLMKQHPTHGRMLLERFYDLPADALDMAFSHHERIAGTGYPRGLEAKEISFWSKLVAIVDVYDAITSERCYHKGASPTEALTRMYSSRLTDFDPELLEQFIQCVGIYPAGTLVELSSGEVGVVIAANAKARLRPKVSLVLDRNKRPYFPSRIMDLASAGGEGGGDTIRAVLAPGAYNIDTQEQIAQIGQASLRRQGSG